MRKLAKYHPFLWLGALSLLLMYLPGWLHAEYDDGGLGGLLVWVGFGIGTVYRWSYRLLLSLAAGEPFTGIRVLAALLGAAVYVGADFAHQRWARRQSPPTYEAGRV